MTRLNGHIEPGPYIEGEFIVVVLDVVTHRWNAEAQLQEALTEPLVLCRDLLIHEHKRYIYPLSVFKSKFLPV